MSYTINISKSVQKQIYKLPHNIIARIIPKIKQLSTNLYPVGSIKLKGYENQYRIRIGDYRVRYEVDDEKALVKLLQCKHRKNIYRDKN